MHIVMLGLDLCRSSSLPNRQALEAAGQLWQAHVCDPCSLLRVVTDTLQMGLLIILSEIVPTGH